MDERLYKDRARRVLQTAQRVFVQIAKSRLRMAQMSTCIVVLGCHRSGSSAVAGVLYRLGVYMGTKFIGKTQYNQQGHWEDKEFVQLHKRITGDWKRPYVDFDPVRPAYAELIKAREKAHSLWGFKDPRLCYVFPYFLIVVPPAIKVKVVLVERDPKAIVRSLLNRKDKKGKKLQVNKAQAARIMRCYEGAKDAAMVTWQGPRLVVKYEHLVSRTSGTVKQIAAFVKRPVRKAAIEFISPKLKHF